MRLAFLLLTLLPLHAQDSRNTDIPHTDTRFAPRTDATLGDWKTRRAHLQKQVLSAAGLLPYPEKPRHRRGGPVCG